MKTRQLLEQARMYEKRFWKPEGRFMDGCPYGCGKDTDEDETLKFLEEAATVLYGGLHELMRIHVQQRIDAGEEIDLACGNSWIWTIFNGFGVSRVVSQEDYDAQYGDAHMPDYKRKQT